MRAVLLAGSGPLNLKVLYCLAQLGAQTHVVATNDSNIVRRSRHFHAFEVHPGVSDDFPSPEAVAWLKDYCEQHRIDVVIPGDIGTAGFLATAGDSLGEVAIFPCSDAAMLERVHDKWIFASTLMKAGIATPRTVLIESVADVAKASDEIGFPMMVKPLSGESSHGVVRIADRDALSRHVQSGLPFASPPLIAQEYVQGRDIDISVLAVRGKVVLGVTQQLEPDGSLRFFADVPTRHLAEAIIAEYGYHGIAHFDMRENDRTGQMTVLECNPRFWYSMPAAMWQGVNFVEAGIRSAMGESVADGTTLIEGRYYAPGALLAALRRPWTIQGLTSRNIRGVLQPALDPMPHLADLYRKARG